MISKMSTLPPLEKFLRTPMVTKALEIDQKVKFGHKKLVLSKINKSLLS